MGARHENAVFPWDFHVALRQGVACFRAAAGRAAAALRR